MSSIVLPSAADATILHQVSHEEDENDTTAATTANNNHNLNQHSTIQQHPSATSLNEQVVNNMCNEEQIGLSLSPSPPSTSPSSSNNEVIHQIANQVSNEILSTAVNSTANNSIQTANSIETVGDNELDSAEGVDITASLLPKPRQQVDNTQNDNSITSTQQQADNPTSQNSTSQNSMYDQQQKAILEERIQTLESNINTLTELCQSLLLQQQQQQGRMRHHSREGSEVSFFIDVFGVLWILTAIYCMCSCIYL